MAEGAAPTRTSEPDIAALGRRFSASVRSVASRLADEEVAAAQIADALLRDHRDYGGEGLLPLQAREGERASVGRWLLRMAGLFDEEAVAQGPSEVIDGRLALLALARLDPGLDGLFRRTGFRRRLRRELKVAAEDVFLDWVLPPPRTGHVEAYAIAGAGGLVFGPAFSPDGSLLAAGGENGVAHIWDAGTGTELSALRGHEGNVFAPHFSPDGQLLASVGQDGTGRLWDVGSGTERAVLRGHEGTVYRQAFSPDGRLLATGGEDGTARLWDVISGTERAVLRGHSGTVHGLAFSPRGRLLLATLGVDDGTVRIWDVASESERAVLRGQEAAAYGLAFSSDGSMLATDGAEGTARIWDVASGAERAVLRGHEGTVYRPAFSPDGRLLVTGGQDGTAHVWDVATGWERNALRGHAGAVFATDFSPDGRMLASAGEDGTVRVWDVASGAERSVLSGGSGALYGVAFSPGGHLLSACGADTTVWEEVEPPGALPYVTPDAIGERRRDLLGITGDVEALANLIAARDTAPPLSIGLFGDWGSGKSFLIKEVQDRVRALTRRSRRFPEQSAYCGYIRDVEFNAWHYADANLWASLVTHIFDRLAQPMPDADIDPETAAAQLARLEEELAASSALRERLERARVQSWSLEARRQLRRLTWGAVGALKDDERLGQLDEDLTTVRGQWRVLVPNGRAAVVTIGLALLVGAAVAGILVGVGVERVWALVVGAAAWIGTVIGWLQVGGRWARRLVGRAGEAVRAEEVKRGDIEARLTATRARESELRQELADLASGRRLGEFVAERSASRDYRGHLGVISQIHRDFDQLSRLLTLQRPDESDLPRIERIVLYIDDLDRCPPRRVVEVLEAVHLILALPLFVVVIAVDPRWLQQSLSLHYAELLAATDAPRDRGIPGRAIDLDGQLQLGLDEMPALVEDDDDEWRPTPLNYLEKIIQIPFTLRPITGRGVTSLVHGLLPIEAPPAEPAPEAPEAEVAADPGSAGTEGAGASGPADDDPHGTAAPAAEAAPPPSPAPSLSPRSLALTPDERDCAARIAGSLRTPRAVKKFTNLYRLVRAGLDEPSGRLDEFLAVGETDLPEYQAVQMLLAVIIAFPEEAPDLLRSFGDLDPDAAPNEASWEEHLGRLRRGAPADSDPGRWREMVGALDASTRELPNGRTSTVEPFRRWGLEVARYSFSTGLRVFAREGHPGRSRERAPTR